ncbi:MAG: winged helix-turn-helix transcriptional regulator [Alistipes sp.]|nr:winged helix-turn-helix transcriptional regulator [Alistipes sp.]
MLAEIAERHGLSVSTVQRRVRQMCSTRIVSKYKEVVILLG